QIDAGTQPTDASARRAFDLQADAFGPGFDGPLVVVMQDRDGVKLADATQLADAIGRDDAIAAVARPTRNEAGTVAVVQAFSRYAPHDERTAQLVDRIRDRVVPLTTTGNTRVLVTGSTAANVDLADQMQQRLPWIIGSVIAVSFVLLMIAFRSLLVPLKAALMNVLSIGAGYGVVVAVFQWGWGRDIVGLRETVPIVSWVPMLMWAILFGLSMDYEVFLISSIRHAFRRHGDNRAAVVEGLGSTGRVITAAALIMLTVFGSFVAYPDPVVKMIGLGLAVAIFVDATVVRMLLVPATMTLLGRANWWLPRRLARVLPSVDLDSTETPERVALVADGGERREPVAIGS
ncbi:MAG TPA: MMPL family transporter, partial [Acidimicrobiia bacterium]|nr:MMPL family transporter [Acidimicrobiia bacterium]